MSDIEYSDFQKKVLSIPEQYDLMLSGGRGGGKSFLLGLLAFRYAEQYSKDARILYVRKTHKSLADFEALTRELFGNIYGSRASYNATEGFWRLPNGAYFELNQLENDRDYIKYQGRSFGLLMCDEVTQYSTPRLLDKLRSNLRGPDGVPVRTVLSGNPGGAGHGWVVKRYINNEAKDFTPFTEPESGRTFVNCPSTYKNNPFIDQQQYRQQLQAALSTDQELLEAWLRGSWDVARGAYFSSVLDKENKIEPLQQIPTNPYTGKKWRTWLAMDHGSSAPTVCYIMAESPGQELNGQYFRKGSIITVDELATNHPNDLNKGMEYTPPHLAELIIEMCDTWNIKPYGVADDACFSNHGHSGGSIAEQFADEGVRFRKAHKGSRKSGWEQMRTMLEAAGDSDKKGLYISKDCSYFWNTVPYLGRDPRNPEDVDTNDFDHGADAIRYGIGHKSQKMQKIKLWGF